MLIILTTVADDDGAKALAERIVSSGLAACVQILPQMTSVYVWEGEVQREGEHLLLIKTLSEKWDELRDLISANHPYEVPEIVGLETDLVSQPYSDWLSKIVGSRDRPPHG